MSGSMMHISDQEALRLAQEAKLEVDREIAAERRAAEAADDDFEPAPVVPEFATGPRLETREARLRALEAGYGKPLPERLRAAMLRVPAAEERSEPEVPVASPAGRRKLGEGARRD